MRTHDARGKDTAKNLNCQAIREKSRSDNEKIPPLV